MRIAILAACCALAAGPALAQSVTLKGLGGQSVVLSAADLAALPQAKVSFDAHGDKHVYEGPLLIDVLAKAGAPTGQQIHGPELADAILVKAADGYQVVFGLGEADPGTRPNRIILAARADDAPLGAKDGPFKVVVEGDLRPARSARMVTEIDLVRLVSSSAAAH